MLLVTRNNEGMGYIFAKLRFTEIPNLRWHLRSPKTHLADEEPSLDPPGAERMAAPSLYSQ